MKRIVILFIVILYALDIGTTIAMRPPRPARVIENKNFTLDAGKSISGDVLVINGNAKIAGRIDGSIVVRRGTLILEKSAVITKDAVAIGSNLKVDKGAKIEGKRITERHPLIERRLSRNNAVHENTESPGRYFDRPGDWRGSRPDFRAGPGSRQVPPPGMPPGPPPHGPFGSRVLFTLIRLSILIGVAILLAKLKPTFLKRTSHVIEENMITTIIAGIVVLAAIFGSMNFIQRAIDMPVFMPLGIVVDSVFLILAVIPARMIGLLLEKIIKQEIGIVQQTILGVLLLGAFIIMPFIGPTISIACTILGLGSMVIILINPQRLPIEEPPQFIPQ